MQDVIDLRAEAEVQQRLSMPTAKSVATALPVATSVAVPPDLTIVVPTLNERGNLEPLLALLETALADIAWEIIFVDDDSTDGTAEHARALARRNPRVRCLQRIGRRGLTTACIEGVLASASPYVAIMDGDLQHDERLLPRMLDELGRESTVDLVVGSRYVPGGEVGVGLSSNRARVSGLATRLARLICKTEIADPMSGFFMFRREIFQNAVHNMSQQGFKILLDLLASSPRPLQVRELPYEFRERRYGESKLDLMVAWEYGMLLADKLIGHIVPVRFALFVLIGTLGLVVHLTVLGSSLALGAHFITAQAVATVVAMTFNFFFNNLFTYYDKRLRGWQLFRGLLSFYLICGLGAVANVGIANYVFHADRIWWVAGIAGVIIGSVWNYAVSSVFTWRNR